MRNVWMTLGLGLALTTFGLGACGKKDGGGAAGGDGAVTVDAKAQAEADQKWTTLCVSCHGETGKGDGPAAASLDPKPRSYADAEWQKSVSDEQLRKVIVEGGAAVGLSPLMPANPDLKDKPAVVQALVNKIRSFQPK